MRTRDCFVTVVLPCGSGCDNAAKLVANKAEGTEARYSAPSGPAVAETLSVGAKENVLGLFLRRLKSDMAWKLRMRLHSGE